MMIFSCAAAAVLSFPTTTTIINNNNTTGWRRPCLFWESSHDGHTTILHWLAKLKFIFLLPALTGYGPTLTGYGPTLTGYGFRSPLFSESKGHGLGTYAQTSSLTPLRYHRVTGRMPLRQLWLSSLVTFNEISMMCWLRIQVLWDTCLLAVDSCSLWENLSSLLVFHFEMWLDTASLTVLRKILTYWFLFTRVIQSSSWCFASLTSVCFDCPRFIWKDIHAGSVCPTKVFQPAVTYP